MRALLLVMVVTACAQDDDSSEGYCPLWLPAPRTAEITVTEGSSTSFTLSTTPFDNSEGVSVMIGTADPSIATMSPRGFGVRSTDPTSPMLEIFGVEDMVAAGDRFTTIQAEFDDCGGGDPGTWANVVVVDRQSPNVLASAWSLFDSMTGFDVVLAQPPPSPVTVMLNPSAGLTTNPTSLVFDATTYGVAQSVTVDGATSGQIDLHPDGGIRMRTVLVSR
jgi:hypothetical protein